MPSTYPPDRESLLVPWSEVFGAGITAAPTSVGLVAAQCTHYMATRAAFVAAWDLCQAAVTKSKGNVSLKDVAKQALVDEIRMLGRIIQSHPGTTNPIRAALGLPERGNGPSPVPVPGAIPKIEAQETHGANITLLITDPDDARRALPKGCQGIQLYYAIAPTAPPAGNGWTNAGVVKRRKIIVALPAGTAGGSLVWFSACFFNPRGMTGFCSSPISAHTGYETGAVASGDGA